MIKNKALKAGLFVTEFNKLPYKDKLAFWYFAGLKREKLTVRLKDLSDKDFKFLEGRLMKFLKKPQK